MSSQREIIKAVGRFLIYSYSLSIGVNGVYMAYQDVLKAKTAEVAMQQKPDGPAFADIKMEDYKKLAEQEGKTIQEDRPQDILTSRSDPIKGGEVPDFSKIPREMISLAVYAESKTGLYWKVILAQWIAENGWKMPKNNNFGNIIYFGGNRVGVYKGMVGKNRAGDVIYAKPLDGVEAYITLINEGEAFEEIRKGIRNGASPQEQLELIIRSKWCETNYRKGRYLRQVYRDVNRAI